MRANWVHRLLKRLGLWREPIVCISREDTYRWPAHLGKQTEGKCDFCGRDIYYEEQNACFRKICNRCEL